MPLSLSLQVHGHPELTHALDQFQGEVKAPRQMFVNLVSDVIAPDIAKRFASQGPGWQPLSPAYAAWKALHHPGKPMLQLRGKLIAAMTDRSRFGGAQSGFAENTLNLTPTGVPYFARQQFGGGGIPARPMIDLQSIQGPIGDYMQHWLEKRAREFGLTVK